MAIKIFILIGTLMVNWMRVARLSTAFWGHRASSAPFFGAPFSGALIISTEPIAGLRSAPRASVVALQEVRIGEGAVDRGGGMGLFLGIGS
jgi:hypothetical protein